MQEAAFVITEKEKPSTAGTRTYTAHNLSEVSVMMPEEIGNRDIVLRRRTGGMQHMKDTHRAADPLSFVSLHPRGQDGRSFDQICEMDSFEGNWQEYEAKRLTASKYYKYKPMSRRGQINWFHLSGRLFQEYVCLSYAKAEQQRFNYIEMNQKQLRSDVYQNVFDHMLSSDVDRNEIGKQIILPATHPGSPRDMHARF